jgi:hypothetical protein
MSTQRSNIGALIAGALLIGFGILALFAQIFNNLHIWSTIWPFVIIGGGLLFFGGMLAGGKSMAGLAIPGSIITVSGLMLLFQNITGLWTTWSYGWTITLASVGLGIFIMGSYQGEEHRKQAGLQVMKVAAVLFIIFGAFFEMLLRPAGLLHSPQIYPVLLILLGAYLVLSRSGLFGSHKNINNSSNSENSTNDLK